MPIATRSQTPERRSRSKTPSRRGPGRPRSKTPSRSADGSTTRSRSKTPTTSSREATTTTPQAEESSKSMDWSGGDGLIPGREIIGPLFLMTTTPVFSIVFYHVVSQMEGDFLAFLKLLWSDGFFTTIYSIWPSPWDADTWKMILSFLGFELLLQKYLPGERFEATTTPKGNVPVYTANGMQAYLTTMATLLLLEYLGWFRPALVYDKFGNILSSMNVFALLFCAMLYVKGHVAPSSTDSGTTGSVVMDYYWGTELYPRILGWDVKMFTNCRAGMMFWAVGIVCFAHKNMEVNGGTMSIGMAVNVALQLVYISKFFYWEMGYMCSMDIQHDRAGYYICWGCLVWVPAVYTSHSFYLAEHAPEISNLTALLIFVFGFLMVFFNFDSDNQRYVFRKFKGHCYLWGREPDYIIAEYKTSSGETRESLLLLDGYWAISRHFHYLPEILAALSWGLPALNTALVGPYFYVFFLTILLTDRAFRDDDRCKKKYGKDWDLYCAYVPYKIIPGIV